jgi:Tfp pilus assembly protein PilZ
MDKFLLDRDTEAEEYTGSTNRRLHIRFPICLEVKYHKDPKRPCRDFTLSIGMGGLFIKTEEPFKTGDRIKMVFCIPPRIKALGEFDGEVVDVSTDNPNHPRGIFVKFIHCGKRELLKLEDLIDERVHLLNNII